MPAFICTTCGTQFAETPAAPPACPICDEYRQYVAPAGQEWTTLEHLRRTHTQAVRREAELVGVGVAPMFGIGQRALLVRTPAGNVLWDCVSLLDPATVELIEGLGGLTAIAISHPHYYTTMVEWSRAFGDVPVWLHARDRDFVMRDDPCLRFWEEDTRELLPGLTLVRSGGHFEGGAVLHCAHLCGGKGALLAGDLLQVVADGRHLGFMRSYPNFIPLGAASVTNIARRIAAFRYDAIYGAWWGKIIRAGAEEAMRVSVERHVHWLGRDDV
jgi:hypothetical protein